LSRHSHSVSSGARVDFSSAQLFALVLAAVAFGSAIGGIRLETLDFRAFYDSALAWRLGHPPPLWVDANLTPNLNPPTLSVLLAPLTFLPLIPALVVWTALGLISLVASLRAIHAHRPLTTREWIWIGIACLGMVPFLMVWACGQLTWVLMYPVTRAWLARTPTRAGLWLSLPVAIKPPLALMALALPWQIWIVAGAGSLAAAAAVAVATGWAPWLAWLSLGRQVDWLGTPMNVSFIGNAARLQAFDVSGPTLADIHPAMSVAIVIGVVAMFAVAIRARGDRRWTLALLWSLFASPLGWIYYLPLGLGPIVSSWPSRRLAALVAVMSLSVPVWLLIPIMSWSIPHWLPGFVAASSLYTVGALAGWYAWVRD